MSPNVASALGALPAFDERGQAIRLGTFWTVRRTVVSFVRHFG
jgi:hypothetical protein